MINTKVITSNCIWAASCEKGPDDMTRDFEKSTAKNGGSNWVLIQGATITVSIVISGLLSLPSCYLENEVGKKA